MAEEDEQETGAIDVVDRLKRCGEDEDRPTIGAIRDALGQRSYGPFLFVPAILEISPIGGIPGVPTVLAAIVVLFAAQMALGRDSFWLPGFIADRGVAGGKLARAADRMRPMAERLDRWFHGRLRPLTRGIWIRIAAIVAILMALTVPPLELLPFASTAPMAAIALLGLALLLHDGLLMLLALVASAAAVAIGLGLLAG